MAALKRTRGGCSGIFAFLFLAGVALLFYEWSSLVDTAGTEGPAAITEKRETVRERFGEWFRQFAIVAAFRVPGSPLERHAICDVEQATYDSLHVGDPVRVHYLPGLLQQPFIPATHLGPCTPAANFGWNPDLYRRLEVLFGSLLAILFFVLVLRIRLAAWLLVPWFGFFLAYGVTPRLEPAPSDPRPAKATVRSIAIVDSMMGPIGRREYSRMIRLQHPYQLVQLEFVPVAASEPVVVIDALDLNSVAGLTTKQVVDIEYDGANPRVGRVRGGTRKLHDQALQQVMPIYGAAVALLAVLVVFSRVFRPSTRRFRLR